MEILLLEVQRGVELSTHGPIHQEFLRVIHLFTSGLLSSESSSLVGLLICPSAICCIQVLGLRVAVAIGQDRDPFGRLILGLLVSIGSTSKTTGVVAVTEVDISGTSVASLSQTSVEVPIGCLVELF